VYLARMNWYGQLDRVISITSMHPPLNKIMIPHGAKGPLGCMLGKLR